MKEDPNWVNNENRKRRQRYAEMLNEEGKNSKKKSKKLKTSIESRRKKWRLAQQRSRAAKKESQSCSCSQPSGRSVRARTAAKRRAERKRMQQTRERKKMELRLQQANRRAIKYKVRCFHYKTNLSENSDFPRSKLNREPKSVGVRVLQMTLVNRYAKLGAQMIKMQLLR